MQHVFVRNISWDIGYAYDYTGQSHAINLSAAAPKPQKIVLAQPRSTAIASAPVTAVNLSKTGTHRKLID